MSSAVDQTLRGRGFAVVVFALVAGLGLNVAAQNDLTSADIQSLQDSAFTASHDVAQLRNDDAPLAAELQRELDDARDEVVYLKVKLRKNERVQRAEYVQLRDRLEAIRTRARGDVPPAPSSTSTRTERSSSEASSRSEDDDVPVGTEFDVRLQSALSSETAQVEDRFEATTLVDLTSGSRVIVPAGSVMRGIITSVKKAGRLERTGSLTVAFDRLTVGRQSYPIRATVTEAIESEGIKGEVGRIGAGAGVGAVIGAILGGAKGALAGILIGGGGTIAATEGKDVRLEPGTVLRVRMDTALNLD
ncbi:MAG TPA: hypothetical protein VM818_20115 [Vicinamibacterales bacterium]|nr:hypothetical protein [Vicinamibacterales bacterium]